MAEQDLPKSRFELLLRGLPGHPLHPPLTDVTVGTFVFATAAVVVGYAGAIAEKTGPAAWLGLIGGLGVAIPTAATGFIDWLYLEWGSARWRTATWHLTAMLSAVALFALAAWRQYPGYEHGDVTLGGFALSIAGLLVLTLGGWLGGSVVFVHGTRVLRAGSEPRERSERPSGPAGTSGHERAASEIDKRGA